MFRQYCRFMQTIKQEITCLSCDRCANTWQPRVEQPVKCPKCGHRYDSARINKTKKVGEAEAVQAPATPTPDPTLRGEPINE